MISTTSKLFRVLEKTQKRKTFFLAVLMFFGGIFESLSVAMIFPLVSAVMDDMKWS